MPRFDTVLGSTIGQQYRCTGDCMPKLQQGTVTRKSGKWLGHFSRWTRDSQGQRKRIQQAFVIGECDRMTLTNARRILRQRLEEELGLRGHRIEVGWFIEQRWKPLREGTWRQSTKEINALFLAHIKRQFGDDLLREIDEVELQAWLNGLAKEYSASMVRHCRHLLKSIFLEAVEQGYLTRSPARLLRMPIVKPVAKPFLTEDEIKKLLETAQGRDRLLLRLILATALRPSELFALRWSCFQPKTARLLITESVYRGKLRPYTKTTDSDSSKSLLQVFLPNILVNELQSYRNGTAPEAFIFPSQTGTPMTKENYQHRVLTPLAKQAGIPRLNFQILRRTASTHLQDLGSPTSIAAIMRHSRPSTSLEHYIQPVDASIREAVEKLAGKLLC
jgi:integrase